MMKKIYLLLITMSFVATTASSQEWVKLMKDKNTNFYTVQNEFNSYWKKQEKKETNWLKKLFGIKKDAEEE